MGGKPDVYQYDDIPQGLRVQIIHIWNDAIGSAVLRSSGHRTTGPRTVWDLIHNQIAKELVAFYLGDSPHADPKQRCEQFLLDASTNEALDIEFSFRAIQVLPKIIGHSDLQAFTSQSADDVIEEFNYRFREHGVGYQFVGSKIVRVDSQYVHVHTEAVQPAISLLNSAGFEGASEEFMKAHDRYREGDTGQAVSESLKAFESTRKAVCDKTG